MCEKIIEKLPSMTAEERQQLRSNCERACRRSPDLLVVQEARRIISEMDTLALREARFLARLPVARRIEYAFRRLPASEQERRLIRILHEHAGATLRRVSAALGNIEDQSWQRHLHGMCRDRRHLIGGDADAVTAPMPHAEDALAEDALAEDALAIPLIELQEAGEAIRLSPAAEAAFASLGYVERTAA